MYTVGHWINESTAGGDASVDIPKLHNILPRAYEEKRASKSQCILCSRQITNESAGYTVLANHPHVNRRDSGREHCYTRNLSQN